MTEGRARFVRLAGSATEDNEHALWPAIVVPKRDLDAEIAELASGPMPENGRRSSIVHPDAESPGLGLAPGIQVVIEVLLPGERTRPIRHNSSTVNFCIAGCGVAVIAGDKIDFDCFDVWITPSFATYWHANESDEMHVRLTYSNAALLEKLHIHYVEEGHADEGSDVADTDEAADIGDITEPGAGISRLEATGAWLMTYEKLIDPDVVEQPVLHWPWRALKAELDKLAALGSDYRGRRLYLCYNPATGRTNGTTNSFFATMTVRPPRIVDAPHRHSAAAINYYFAGSGYSRVNGERLDWKSGDLMFSAPGWAVHHHASNDETVYELTVQDTPFNLAIDSLMWQEDLTRPPRLLGSHRGFHTNRAQLGVGDTTSEA